MFTKEEHQKITELMNSNEEFSYFINKSNQECKLITSQISHEIRNPLTLIKSTVQLIESMHPEAKEFKYWGQLTEDINGLEFLLTELSMFNNSENVSIQKQDFLLLIKSVLGSFRPQAELRNIELSLTITEESIPYFNNYPHDRIKFQRVFTNLIRNAFEAIKDGGSINIECLAFPPSHINIVVSNNGKIIPEDELPTIFEPFVTYKSGGSGLGLAICTKVVAAHNGTLSVSSTEEKTSFSIQLPLN